MSGKQEKKLRQLHRKDFAKKINPLMDDLQRQMNGILKPAPRLMPKQVWRGLQRLFLNI